MSTFHAHYTITRTRTIIETATAVVEIDAETYGDAGDEAEDLDPSLSEDVVFETLSEEIAQGPSFLSSIARQPDAPVVEEPDADGLTPAYYEASPQPSGGRYFPVQVEPTPDLG